MYLELRLPEVHFDTLFAELQWWGPFIKILLYCLALEESAGKFVVD